MRISEVSIRRPVFTVIMSVVLLLFGLLSYFRLGVDQMPKVEAPFASISVEYPGADPEVVENRVIKPIEDSVATISGLKKISATAVESYGLVMVEFELSVKADRAIQDVRDKVAKIQSDLPSDAEQPVIEKIEIGAAPVVALVLTAPAKDSMARITYVADQIVKPQIQRLNGVGTVNIIGKQTREIHVIVDPERLRVYNLTLNDVQNTLSYGNLDVPGGRITSKNIEYLVKTHGEATRLDQIKNLVVASPQGAPIKISDIAQVTDSTEEARTIAAYDKSRALSLLVLKQSDANTVAVSDSIIDAVTNKEIDLPNGYKLQVAQNSSTFTKNSIHAVRDDLILGALLAIAVILFFLRDGRATFISALALPTSVIATFAFMRAMNFTLNNLTMLALSLSIGMLIDDAIVVIENIYRHIEAGKSPFYAAKDGVGEIGLAVFATTLSIVAVFVPVAFTEGMVGRFFYEFGITVAFAVLVSLFVSFTLTPMAAARLLKHHNPGKLAKRIGAILDEIDRIYRRTISWVLNHSIKTIATGVMALIAALLLSRYIPIEFQSNMDTSEIDVAFYMPEGTSIDATFARGEAIASLIKHSIPEALHELITVGAGRSQKVNEGKVFVKLVNSRERQRSQLEISADIRKKLAKEFPQELTAVSRAAQAGSAGGEMFSRPLNIQLRGEDMQELRKASQNLMNSLNNIKGFVDLTASDRGTRPQLGFTLKRDKIADAGLAPVQVAMAIRTAINGTKVSQFRDGSDRYNVVVKAPDRYRHDCSAVQSIPLRTPMGGIIEIGELVEPAYEEAPSQIERENRIRQVTILGNLDNIVLGDAQNIVSDIVKKVIPSSVKLSFGGQGELMKETFISLTSALLLGVLLIYLVLSAQFESFLHPITIMMSLPLSLVGALSAILLTGQSMNIMTFIGLIMLMGLVTKNAILLVDRANQKRSDGASIREALIEAGVTRLRPILMTTAAMIFGMLPVAIGLGEGSELRSPMGIAVIGGLITSTLLTLLVVPVVYSALESIKRKLFKRSELKFEDMAA
ncbi:MAG: efflux RND transporter permease subunit [Deltaproteobacteria bacterium]|nr:efflux RND transporter permease subunit [Deltaproteobacteria bacterium]